MLPQMLEGQVILIQSADLVQSRKMIPDLATWLECYSLYVAVVAAKQLERTPELMAYQSQLTRASIIYKWPGCMIKILDRKQPIICRSCGLELIQVFICSASQIRLLIQKTGIRSVRA